MSAFVHLLRAPAPIALVASRAHLGSRAQRLRGESVKKTGGASWREESWVEEAFFGSWVPQRIKRQQMDDVIEIAHQLAGMQVG